jgi:hypothetical protein
MATTSESLAFDRGVRPMLEIVLPEKAEADCHSEWVSDQLP